MADYVKWLWNSPMNGQSPYNMFGGVMKPDGKDADGNIVYRYNPSVAGNATGGGSACK